jgi:hypothetical protein
LLVGLEHLLGLRKNGFLIELDGMLRSQGLFP